MIDNSQVRAFQQTLDGAPALLGRDVKAIITKGAVNIKKQQVAEARTSKHFAQIASAINFDVTETSAFGGGVIQAEIGPNKGRRAGRLANIAYFGTSRGGGTVADPGKALEAEAPNVERYLADAMIKALGA